MARTKSPEDDRLVGEDDVREALVGKSIQKIGYLYRTRGRNSPFDEVLHDLIDVLRASALSASIDDIDLKLRMLEFMLTSTSQGVDKLERSVLGLAELVASSMRVMVGRMGGGTMKSTDESSDDDFVAWKGAEKRPARRPTTRQSKRRRQSTEEEEDSEGEKETPPKTLSEMIDEINAARREADREKGVVVKEEVIDEPTEVKAEPEEPEEDLEVVEEFPPLRGCRPQNQKSDGIGNADDFTYNEPSPQAQMPGRRIGWRLTAGGPTRLPPKVLPHRVSLRLNPAEMVEPDSTSSGQDESSLRPKRKTARSTTDRNEAVPNELPSGMPHLEREDEGPLFSSTDQPDNLIKEEPQDVEFKDLEENVADEEPKTSFQLRQRNRLVAASKRARAGAGTANASSTSALLAATEATASIQDADSLNPIDEMPYTDDSGRTFVARILETPASDRECGANLLKSRLARLRPAEEQKKTLKSALDSLLGVGH